MLSFRHLLRPVLEVVVPVSRLLDKGVFLRKLGKTPVLKATRRVLSLVSRRDLSTVMPGLPFPKRRKVKGEHDSEKEKCEERAATRVGHKCGRRVAGTRYASIIRPETDGVLVGFRLYSDA